MKIQSVKIRGSIVMTTISTLLFLLQMEVSDSFTLRNSFGSYKYCNTNIANDSPSSHIRYDHELQSVTKSQTAILDGSSFNSLDLFLAAEGKSSRTNANHGYCSFVTAKVSNNQRVIAIQAQLENREELDNLETILIDDGVEVYKDSLATIPNSISDEDAISTAIAAITGIHCAIYNPTPINDKLVKNVGGSSENFISSATKSNNIDNKKAVVVGGGDYASFVADGLAAMGAEVTQVSTNKMLRPRKYDSVSISPPAVGDLNLGFASSIGHFHVLIDTLSDEAKAGESMCIGVSNEWDDFSTANGEECSSAVIMQLKKQHGCNRYISTMCNAQRMVRDNGLIFGRNDAIKYTKEIGKTPFQMKGKHILPPKHFGTKTLQKLLDSNVLFKSNNKEQFWVQGWSMKDYWELTSWPRDVSAAANVRFGFPVVDDLDTLFDNEEIGLRNEENLSMSVVNEDDDNSAKKVDFSSKEKENPFVTKITGVTDLSSAILKEKKKCVLFLSSTSCRTCKYLTPQYTKLSKDFYDQDLVFAKVNAFSKKGKELSKVLAVEAVPAFVFFRDGQRFGSTLSVTRIPSKKLDLALDLLCSGEDWDAKSINKL